MILGGCLGLPLQKEFMHLQTCVLEKPSQNLPFQDSRFLEENATFPKGLLKVLLILGFENAIIKYFPPKRNPKHPLTVFSAKQPVCYSVTHSYLPKLYADLNNL